MSYCNKKGGIIDKSVVDCFRIMDERMELAGLVGFTNCSIFYFLF